MYVTDGVSGNKAVWVVKGTINGGTVIHEGNVINPIRWNGGDFCDLGNATTHGIAVNSNVTKPNPPNTAYITSPAVDPRWIYAFSIPGNTRTCYPGLVTGYPQGTFSQPTDVAWLVNSRAYVANSTDRRVTAIQQNPNDAPNPNIMLAGSPQSVTITSGTYATGVLGPSPSVRVR